MLYLDARATHLMQGLSSCLQDEEVVSTTALQ